MFSIRSREKSPISLFFGAIILVTNFNIKNLKNKYHLQNSPGKSGMEFDVKSQSLLIFSISSERRHYHFFTFEFDRLHRYFHMIRVFKLEKGVQITNSPLEDRKSSFYKTISNLSTLNVGNQIINSSCVKVP